MKRVGVADGSGGAHPVQLVVLVGQVIVERVPPNKKKAKHEDNRKEEKGKCDPLAYGQSPPSIIQPVRRARAGLCHRGKLGADCALS